MAKKKETGIITSEEWHELLNACINCVFEETCDNILPFPINLEKCCDKYQKKRFS